MYPIMLNNLFHGSAGFAWGVRASGFLTLGVLAAANYLMSANIPEDESKPPQAKICDIIRDIPFMITVCGG